MSTLENSSLGKKVNYESKYNNDLLYGIPRALNRSASGITKELPFKGEDLWNLYEISWLNPKGKPKVAMAEARFAIDSVNLIESKSFKLYLNSFNQTKFETREQVRQQMESDLSHTAQGKVSVIFDPPSLKKIGEFNAICIDDEDIDITCYTPRPGLLENAVSINDFVDETLYSHLFKSNCPVTGQPDWATVLVDYKGPAINRKQLLRYLVSFREHQAFHEQCVELIFLDLKHFCQCERLTVSARFTRRGGLDINPVRSDMDVEYSNTRMERQ